MMKRFLLLLSAVALMFVLVSCKESQSAKTDFESGSAMNETTTESTENQSDLKIRVKVGNRYFSAAVENNEAAKEFVKMLPLDISADDYRGFEKVGKISKNLPSSDRRITTVAGDIVLYNGNQIVVFYGSNTWEYTPLAHIDNLDGFEEALKGEKAVITFLRDDK